MLEYYDLIYSTGIILHFNGVILHPNNIALKWSQSRLHTAARVLMFEVLVMLCWRPERKNLLPKLLTELLTAASNFLSQVNILD